MNMDYNNGKIYTIRSNQTDDIYIGSTCTPLYKRFHNHKQDYKKWIRGKKRYMTSYEIIKYDDCYIELLEECPCENIEQLRKREGHYIRIMDCVNKVIPGRTKKEYDIENRDKLCEYKKQYRIDNREKIKEERKPHIYCDCGGKYKKQHKSTHERSKKHQNYINNIST
jgi:hypothetical protein